MTSGFLDSIGAMELVGAMQDDLGIPLAELELRDLATVTTLVAAVAAAEQLAAVAARRPDSASAAPAEEW